jgi:hypothetical protein
MIRTTFRLVLPNLTAAFVKATAIVSDGVRYRFWCVDSKRQWRRHQSRCETQIRFGLNSLTGHCSPSSLPKHSAEGVYMCHVANSRAWAGATPVYIKYFNALAIIDLDRTRAMMSVFSVYVVDCLPSGMLLMRPDGLRIAHSSHMLVQRISWHCRSSDEVLTAKQ